MMSGIKICRQLVQNTKVTLREEYDDLPLQPNQSKNSPIHSS
jgi:hypothetical protein